MTAVAPSVTVRYFAGAAEAAGVTEEQLAAGTVGELRSVMVAAHGAALDRVLQRCSLLVGGVRTTDPAAVLADGSRIDVLPPFAGG